jgi:hypothetical protein
MVAHVLTAALIIAACIMPEEALLALHRRLERSRTLFRHKGTPDCALCDVVRRAPGTQAMVGPEPICLVLTDESWEILPLSQIPAGTTLAPTEGSRKVKVVTAGWSPCGRAVIVVPIPTLPKGKIRNRTKVMTDRCTEGMLYCLWFLLGSRPE